MRYLYIVYCFFTFSILLLSCSKDKGNYDYTDVNQINIGGLLEGDHHTNRIYNLAFGDTLNLNPIITGSLSGDNTEGLEFEWKIDGQNESSKQSLTYIANKNYGKLKAEFIVYDKSTSLKSSYNFFVNVVNPFKLGYYFLSKKGNSDAILYCKSSVQENSNIKEILLPSIGELGKNPIYISSSRKYGASSTDYYNQITIGVKNAKNPVLLIDSREFVPTLLYNSDSYTGDKSNFVFEPSDILSDPFNPIIYATVKGKIHILQKGAISTARLSDDVLNYQVDKGGIAIPRGNGGYFISFFDSKNNKLRVADNSISGFAYDYNRIFDSVIPDDLTLGQSFLCGSAASINGLNYVYLLRKDNKMFSYVLNYADTYMPSDIQKLAEGTVPDNGNITQAIYNVGNNSWYIAVGRKIFRSSYLGLEFQKEIELPQDATGIINKFHYDSSNNKLLISTYDSAYSGDKKSSIYIYNTLNNTLEYSAIHAIEEVVGLFVGI